MFIGQRIAFKKQGVTSTIPRERLIRIFIVGYRYAEHIDTNSKDIFKPQNICF